MLLRNPIRKLVEVALSICSFLGHFRCLRAFYLHTTIIFFFKFQFEALFRSVHLAFVDHCSHEFLFLTDFFMVSGQAAIDLHSKVLFHVSYLVHQVALYFSRSWEERLLILFELSTRKLLLISTVLAYIYVFVCVTNSIVYSLSERHLQWAGMFVGFFFRKFRSFALLNVTKSADSCSKGTKEGQWCSAGCNNLKHGKCKSM